MDRINANQFTEEHEILARQKRLRLPIIGGVIFFDGPIMSFDDVISFTVLIVPFLYLGIAVLGFVPQISKTFVKWKETKKVSYFSSMILLSFFSFQFLLGFYLSSLQNVLRFVSYLSSYLPEDVRLLTLLVVFGSFLQFLGLPMMYRFFQRWKRTQKALHFTMAIFFSSLSFYAFLLIFVSFKPTWFLLHNWGA